MAAGAFGGAFLLTSFTLAQPPAPREALQSPRADRWLEFDLPRDASGITGFEVGFFVPGDPTPMRSYDVPRSSTQAVARGSVRLPLRLDGLPPGHQLEIRLRTIAGERRSVWSEPSGTLIVPGGRASETPAPRARSVRSARTELAAAPDLEAKLAQVFPGVELPKAAEGYRRLRDLTADLYAARNLKVPFEAIKRLTADAGNRNLRAAIATLKPRVDARAESRRAVSQARDLLEGRRR